MKEKRSQRCARLTERALTKSEELLVASSSLELGHWSYIVNDQREKQCFISKGYSEFERDDAHGTRHDERTIACNDAQREESTVPGYVGE